MRYIAVSFRPGVALLMFYSRATQFRRFIRQVSRSYARRHIKQKYSDR